MKRSASAQSSSSIRDLELELQVLRKKRMLLKTRRAIMEHEMLAENLNSNQHVPWPNSDNDCGIVEPNLPYNTKKLFNNIVNLYESEFQSKPPKIPLKTSDKRDFILRNDIAPSRQLTGRIDLAVGTILKSVKQEAKTIVTANQLKIVKQEIRKRLYKLMMGKVVTVDSAIDNYFKEYNTVDDLVALAELKPEGPPKKRTVSSKDYIQKNLPRVLERCLDRVFNEAAKLNTKDSTTTTSKDNQLTTKDIETHENLIKSLINELLPVIIPKYKNLLFEMVKAEFNIKEKETNTPNPNNKDKLCTTNAISNTNTITNLITTNGSEVYHAKIVAEPTLPQKAAMQAFLENLKTAYVKKHKTRQNLLFIGLTNKADYDYLLVSNNTLIDGCKLLISSAQSPKASSTPVNETPVIILNINNKDSVIAQSPNHENDNPLTNTSQESDINDNSEKSENINETTEICSQSTNLVEEIENSNLDCVVNDADQSEVTSESQDTEIKNENKHESEFKNSDHESETHKIEDEIKNQTIKCENDKEKDGNGLNGKQEETDNKTKIELESAFEMGVQVKSDNVDTDNGLDASESVPKNNVDQITILEN